jgi:hypothetical protein
MFDKIIGVSIFLFCLFICCFVGDVVANIEIKPPPGSCDGFFSCIEQRQMIARKKQEEANRAIYDEIRRQPSSMQSRGRLTAPYT